MGGRVTRLEGFREAREQLHSLAKAAQTKIGNRAIMVPATVLADAVRAKAPVSTRERNKTKGSLRDSVKAAKSRKEKGRPTAVVLAEDVAAVPNEFGTSKMQPQPFFRPAVDANRDAAGRAFAEALKTEVDAEIQRVAKG